MNAVDSSSSSSQRIPRQFKNSAPQKDLPVKVSSQQQQQSDEDGIPEEAWEQVREAEQEVHQPSPRPSKASSRSSKTGPKSRALKLSSSSSMMSNLPSQEEGEPATANDA